MRLIRVFIVCCLFVGLLPVVGQGAEWQLVWGDDFDRSEIGDAWELQDTASIVEGRLRLPGVHQAIIRQGFKPDVRLEFEAESLPGIPPCDMSATIACGDYLRRGYLLGFGARSNRAYHVMGPGIHWANEDPEFVIEPGKRYHLVAQKEGDRLTYIVNGTTIIDQTVDDPIGGPNFDRVGVLTWTGMTVDNVRVYERTTPHPKSPRALASLPAGPLYLDGRQLRIRDGHESPGLKRGVDAYNARDLEAALREFGELGPTFEGLLGQAYVYGDLDYMEPVYHSVFEELAARFEAASQADPGHQPLADHALAAKWFSRLVMWRRGSGGVAVVRLRALGRENNPYYDKTQLYLIRYHLWGAMEGGSPKGVADARAQARELLQMWPGHRILSQYAGEQIPWGEEYLADTDKHPAWAAYLREAYARAIAIMERFIDLRQQPDGQMGGGYGDDVEMMRTWMQIAAISTASEGARAGIETLAAGVWNHVLLKGFDKTFQDVEHSAECSADALPGMLLVRHGDPLWVERNLESCRTIKNYYMGIDDKGYPRFKCSSFGGLETGDPVLSGGDTGYCARAMKHFLWAAWQGNTDARDWLVQWAEGWRIPSVREIEGKLAGFVPLTLWYPTGGIMPPVEGKSWHDEALNYWPRPDMIHDVFLAAYWLTRDPKFLEPFQMAMQHATQGPLPKGNFEPGSRQWQLVNLAHLPNSMPTEQHKVAVYRWLTGDTTYDSYVWRRANPAIRFRLTADLDEYLKTFKSAAEGTRYNLDMQTSEVMAMDRAGVPSALAIFGAYTGAITGMRDMATPTFSVTYETPTTDFAALVVHASETRLRLWLYNFDAEPMPIGLKLWRLQPGVYVLEQGEQLPGERESQYRYAWESPRDIECIHKGAGPTIVVPPGKVWAVDLRLKEAVLIPTEAPDLAVMSRDMEKVRDMLHVTVHNIGNGDADRFALVVENDAHDELARQEVSGLAAPRDLLPSTRRVSIKLPQTAEQSDDVRVRIELPPDAYESYPSNNTAVLPPSGSH